MLELTAVHDMPKFRHEQITLRLVGWHCMTRINVLASTDRQDPRDYPRERSHTDSAACKQEYKGSGGDYAQAQAPYPYIGF